MRHLPLAAAIVITFASAAFGAAADVDTKGAVPAVAADGDLVAVVISNDTALSCAVSRDGGATFAAPTPVGTVTPGQMLGMRRGPQVAVKGNTILIATNIGKAAGIRAFRSADAGKTWKGPFVVDEPAGRAPEGLMSIAATKDGFAVVFLELVNKAMQISLARSVDGGNSFLKTQTVYTSPDGHVCECCQPTITSDRAGNIAVMFRNTVAGNRDMYLTTSKDDGKTFSPAAKLGDGTWKLNACPMDGGGVTLSDKSPLAVFRRQGSLYTVRPGDTESKFADGKNPVVASSADGPVIAWESKSGVAVRVPKSLSEISIDGAAAPVLATTSRGVLLAYATLTGRTHTRLVYQPKP